VKKILLLSTVTASLLLGSGHDDHADHSEIAINLVGDFSYVNRSQELHEVEAPAFFHAGEDDGHDHGGSVASKGFNFNSAELEVEAPIGENFEAFATFHLSEDSFEVEELYGKTMNKHGLNIKAGKFLSSFGYSNSKHSESLDFNSKPMIQDFVFGDHGLNEKGVGLSWNNKNILVGLEVLQGENERSFGTGEIEYEGLVSGEIEVEGNDGADLTVAYVKGNKRLGTTLVNGGISLAKGKTRIDHTTDDTPHAVESDTTITGLELGATIPFTRVSNLTLNSEYIKREFDGTKYVDTAGTVTSAIHTRDQSGINVSAVYTIDPTWKVGVSMDKILDNKVNGTDQDVDFEKTSVMAEYTLNENNKFRLQYDKDESKYTDADGLLSYNQVMLQWQFNFGTGKHNH
jgi:opacity protein-like surface antigen